MNFANTFRIEEFPDHVIVHFGVKTDPPAMGGGGETAGSIALPITIGGQLAAALFAALARSSGGLTVAFTDLQKRFAELNTQHPVPEQPEQVDMVPGK